MSKYHINLYKLAVSLLPSPARGILMKAVLKTLILPFNRVISQLKDFGNSTTRKLTYNGQVFSLERMLNQETEQPKGTITITDGDSISGLYFYDTLEWKPILFGTVMFTNSEDWHLPSFVVHVPASLFDDNNIKNKIISLVNQYKLTGTKYIIKRV